MKRQLERKVTYWGGVDFVRASTGLAVKVIYMRSGCQSSLEYHVKKHEIYWLAEGELKIGLRSGRGVNSSVTLKEGECYEIAPGTMHMRIALTDCAIYEACSYDDDSDTFIVEPGETYQHKDTIA
jgi:mannose-6-phosphate isomerase-like protein (cupin superfamily)